MIFYIKGINLLWNHVRNFTKKLPVTHTAFIGKTENPFAKVTVSKCVKGTEIETNLNTYIGVHINKIYNVRLYKHMCFLRVVERINLN